MVDNLPDKHEETSFSTDDTGRAEVFAGLSTLVAIAATVWANIDSKIYKNLSSLGLFEDMKPKRRKDADEIIQKVRKGHITTNQAYVEFDHLIDKNAAEAAKRIEEVGAKGLGKQWGLLRTHQKAEVALFAAATGGITLGTMFPIIKSWQETSRGEEGKEKEHVHIIHKVPENEIVEVNSIQANAQEPTQEVV